MQSRPSSHRYKSQRLNLHYVDWGNPSAPTLLLVHGGKDHCRSWDWVAEQLSKDWHVIAPDLRGHGDSDWTPDGNYTQFSFVYDIAQLVHQLQLDTLTIVAHSMGGMICSRYAGLYPQKVKSLVLIEGLGYSPKMLAEQNAKPRHERLVNWIEQKRDASGRHIKRYQTLDEAYQRMKTANSFLTEEQARHLTIHGSSQNEDGSYSWKFDNYLNISTGIDIPDAELRALWERITCPTLLLYGKDSWASSPAKDGRLKHFNNATFKEYENAGHWLHHDQFERLMQDLNEFL
jgi:pimeloyl-ACP methyl ester carboxylesterase